MFRISYFNSRLIMTCLVRCMGPTFICILFLLTRFPAVLGVDSDTVLQDDKISHIRLILPKGVEYPESGLEAIAIAGKDKIESTYPNISVIVTMVDSNDKNLVLDAEVTKPLFRHTQQKTHCIGLSHSKVGLEMATFLKLPTVSISTLILVENGSQLPINPQYWASTKAFFNLLDQFQWTRVNFVVSTLPWFWKTWLHLQDNMKQLAQLNYHDSVLVPQIEVRTDKFVFSLDSYNKDSDFYEDIVISAQTSNIFVFIGHVCELRRYILTAFQEGYLVAGKVVVFLDVYGQMVSESGELSSFDCTHFSSWVGYEEDRHALASALQFVVIQSTHWTDISPIDRAQFLTDYNIASPSDLSGLDLLLADSLDLLAQYINRTDRSVGLHDFVQSTSLGLYSGKVVLQESGWRELPVGVRFYHGNGNVHFMSWMNSCQEVYCPATTLTGKKVQWADGIVPISAFTFDSEGLKTYFIILPLIATLVTAGLMAWSANHFYKKRKCVSSQKHWSLDKADFKFDDNLQFTTKRYYSGAFPKIYKNTRNSSGKYKNCGVFVKEIYCNELNIVKDYGLITQLMKRVGGKNENVNYLVGVLERPGNLQLIQLQCSNGSLFDVIEANPMKIMDNFEFKLHVLLDVARGIDHLHSTLHIPHANLKTSNCLVDSRWTVKVSDFEPSAIRDQLEEDVSDVERCSAQRLWIAPELLQRGARKKLVLKQSDVYSFAMLSFHVLTSSLPFCEDQSDSSFAEIINRVKESSEPPFRPQLKMSDCNDNEELLKLVKDCWSQTPITRPTFPVIRDMFDSWGTVQGQSFGDFIADQMEEYSFGLDQKVKEMEDKLLKERIEFEKLLQKMLPRQIASCIKAGRQPAFEQAEVSLYFSDIYNFTKISQLKKFREDPRIIVEFLNGLYEVLDTIVSCFQEKLYKVETINDSYLVMSGLPVRQERNCYHAGFIANFALYVLSRVNEIEIEGYPDVRVQIRIGIHSGYLAAGVIGKLNPRYCLFGDAVNFTARLEGTGKPFTIHTSKTTVDLLKEGGLFKIVERNGMVTLKNRGEHQTYFVVGMQGFEWELPKETVRLQRTGDAGCSDTESVTSSSAESMSDFRKISNSSTDYTQSVADSSSFLQSLEPRCKKLSSSKLEMQNSVSYSMLMIDKMKKPVLDKLNVFDMEHMARRAFSEPDGGNLIFESSKKQRMSTPFRKESDESLYYHGKTHGRDSNCLLTIPEPSYDKITPPDSNTTSSSSSRDPLDEKGIEETAGISLSELYNHDEDDSGRFSGGVEVPPQDDGISHTPEEDISRTPEDLAERALLKRRDTNQTIVAPSAFALANSNCSMGVKRYSKKRLSSESHDFDHSDESS